jgi:hypothetical protein
MLWHKVTLNRDQLEAGEKTRILDEFRQLHKDAAEPADAVLMESILPDQLGAIDVYFSPSAATITQHTIDRLAGIPCNPPPRQQVAVIYGSPESLDLLEQTA